MAEKKSTAKRKTSTKKTKKEVVDTGAAKEFVEMMTNKPVSEIETKVDEVNINVDINGVGVPCQDSKCVGMVGPNCDDVIEAEIEITNMIVDEMANDIDDKVVNQTPDDVDSGLDVLRNEDGWPILQTENIVSFGNIDEKVNDMVDSEICKMAGEMANAYGEFFETLKGVDDNIENEVEGIKNIVDELTKTEEMPKPQYRYVTSAMGVSYD